MAAPNPMTHKCGLGTLDYRGIDHGRVSCRLSAGGCGASYEFLPGVGWRRDPRPVKRGR